MEEYVNKRNYLNHLKQISAIKNGHYISGITKTKSKVNLIGNNTLRQNNFFTNTSSKSQLSLTRRSNQPFTTRNKSTEQIIKAFLIQKENLRLVQRIGSMNSEIKMKKYQQEYKENKKLMKIHAKIKKPPEYFIFKVFDIKFQSHIVQPDEVFTIYQVVKHKKKLITQGTIFQLRKQDIKTSKNQTHFLKIEAKQSGVVQLSMTCFLPIIKNKQEIGNLVIDII